MPKSFSNLEVGDSSLLSKHRDDDDSDKRCCSTYGCCPNNKCRRICCYFFLLFLVAVGAFVAVGYPKHFWLDVPKVYTKNEAVTDGDWGFFPSSHFNLDMTIEVWVDNPNPLSITADWVKADVFLVADDWTDGDKNKYLIGKAKSQTAFKVGADKSSHVVMDIALKSTDEEAFSVVTEATYQCTLGTGKVRLHLEVTAGINAGLGTIPIPQAVPVDIKVHIPGC